MLKAAEYTEVRRVRRDFKRGDSENSLIFAELRDLCVQRENSL